MIAIGKGAKGADAGENLRTLGTRLKEFAAQPYEAIETAVRSGYFSTLKGFALGTAKSLSSQPGAPTYWKADMANVIADAERAAAKADASKLFWDVPGFDPDKSDTWVRFASWLSKLGDTIEIWPALFDAALDRKAR